MLRSCRTAVRSQAPGVSIGLVALFVALGGTVIAHESQDGPDFIHACINPALNTRPNVIIRTEADDTACADPYVEQHWPIGGAGDGRPIARDAVRTEHIADGEVKTADIGSRQVHSEDIGIFQVHEGHLRPQSVQSLAIEDDGIAEKDLRPGSVSGRVLAGDSVDGGKVADGSLGGADLAGGSIGGAHLAANSIQAGHIPNESVPLTKLESRVLIGIQRLTGGGTKPTQLDTKTREARCAEGWQSVGGGYLTNDNDPEIEYSYPTTTGWRVRGTGDGKWFLQAWVVCAKFSPVA